MNKLKKLLSVLILWSFLLWNTNSASALVMAKGIDLGTSYFDYWIYSSSEYENEILKLNSWKILISRINTLMSKAEKNQKLLDSLDSKLAKVSDKYNYYELSEKEKQMFLIINYIRAKIKDSKLALKSATYLTNISESDQKALDEKLVKLQLSFIDNLEKAIKEATKYIKEYSSYEEKWNFKMDILVDEESLWKFDAKFNINNYQINVSEFDSQIKWHIEAIINAVPKWEKQIKLEIKSFVDFISKDWNYYLLMKNLETKDEAWLYSMFIEPAKTLFKDWKYLKFSDKVYADILTKLETIDHKTIFKDLKQDFSKPLFKAYKKSWNRYYVVPTKYACDKVKEFANKFDPINWKTCSNSQYNELLSNLSDIWAQFYVDLWNNTVFGFSATKVNQIEKISGEMNFVDTSLEKVTFSVVPDQKLYPKDWISFEYARKKSITLKTIISDLSLNLNMLVNLNSDNSFSNVNLDLTSKFADSKMNISNGNISWTTSIKERSKEVFKITTSWKYADKYLKLDNKINFSKNPFTALKLHSSSKSEKLSWNFNLEIDLKDNKDNVRMNINGSIWTKKILEMNISNDWKIEFKNVEIKAPADSQVIDMNEIY